MSSQWPEPKIRQRPKALPHVILTRPPYVILNGVKDPVWGRSQSQ